MIETDKLAEAFKRWWAKEGTPFPVNSAHYMTAWNAWRASALAEYDAQPAQAAQPVGVPDGWVMVPREPTQAMLSATMRKGTANECRSLSVLAYHDMLAAAPQPPAQPSADAEDAARYRWLRDNPEHPSSPYFGDGLWYMPYMVSGAGGIGGGVGAQPFDSLDAAIDAARAAEGNGNGE